MQLKHRDRIEVEKGGEELVVHNTVSVTMAHHVSGGNPTHETFYGASRIEGRGGGPEPNYITTWAAEELWHEHGIDLFDGHDCFDIEVVDLESDEVTVL